MAKILIAGILWLMGTVAATNALAQDISLTPTPVTEELGQRFILMVLDQPDQDLLKSNPKINMMFDTRTGRSWVLEYARKPNSNEQGYVWVEVPIRAPAGVK